MSQRRPASPPTGGWSPDNRESFREGRDPVEGPGSHDARGRDRDGSEPGVDRTPACRTEH